MTCGEPSGCAQHEGGGEPRPEELHPCDESVAAEWILDFGERVPAQFDDARLRPSEMRAPASQTANVPRRTAAAASQRLYDEAGPVLDHFESVFEDVRRFARGQRETLRLGYVASAAGNFLNGALGRLRESHPEIRLQLLDLSPGEQLASLRTAAIDVALVVLAGAHPHREFYARRLAAIPVTVALPTNSPLVGRARLGIADLRDESFIGASDDDMPGFNQWLVQLGRGAGFRPVS